jgi:plasmid stabilization system protein ParE
MFATTDLVKELERALVRRELPAPAHRRLDALRVELQRRVETKRTGRERD